MSEIGEKTEIKFNQEHYDLLKKCSDKKDMTQWNNYSCDFTTFIEYSMKTQKRNVPHLENAQFHMAYLEDSQLSLAHMEGSEMYGAYLKGAILNGSHLEGAILTLAHLENAQIYGAYLENAQLYGVHLENAQLIGVHLEGADLKYATCNGSTQILDCFINKETDFRSVGLDNIQWSSGLKQLAEYNNRRLDWIDWYRGQRQWWQLPKALAVRFFWGCSDYGRSTQRILWTFTGLSLIFAWAYFCWPEMIQGFYTEGMTAWFVVLRSVYFSVVTMTTLGFGDIYANKTEPWGWWNYLGHVLLIAQVIIGYVILGALVTRLSILFNSDGPSADFAKPDPPKSWADRLKDWWKAIQNT